MSPTQSKIFNDAESFLTRKDLTIEEVEEFAEAFANSFLLVPKKEQNETKFDKVMVKLADLIQKIEDEADGELLKVAHQSSNHDSQIYDQSKTEAIVEGLTGLDYDVAKAFHAMYPDMFKYWRNQEADKDTRWLMFLPEKHRWVKGADIYIHLTLSTDFYNVYKRLCAVYNEEMKKEEDENKKASIAIHIKQATLLMAKLKKTTFKKCIISELATLCYDVSIMDKFDTNIKLLGFTNGVFDLNKHVFRAGKADDYITKSVGYDYIEDPDHMKDVETYFNDIMLDVDDNKNYLLRILGSCLEGYNTNEIAACLEGTGSNSKGKLMLLLKKAFGQYAYTLQPSLITKELEADKPSSQLYNARFCRIAFMSEPSKGKINTETFKTLTGRDDLNIRDLFGRATESIPHWTLILMFNQAPIFEDDSQGIKRRIVNIPFNAMFTDEIPTQPWQKKKDASLLNKFPAWKQACMKLLIKYHREWANNDFLLGPKPVDITEASEGMLEVENCPYKKWFDEKVEMYDAEKHPDANKEDYWMTLKEASVSCDTWLKVPKIDDLTIGNVSFSKKTFKNKVSGFIGIQPYGQKKIKNNTEKNVWTGYKLMK